MNCKIDDVIRVLKSSNFLKVVYTYGVWDLIHPGHIRLLERAKALGDVLIVGTVTDAPVRELKGQDRPVQTFEDRSFIVGSLKCVDFAIRQSDYDPTFELKYLVEHGVFIDIITKGDDWEKIPGSKYIESIGGRLVKLSYSKEWSTSRIVEKISGKPVEKFGEPKL